MKFIAKIVMFSLCIANVHAELLIIKRVQPQTAAASNSSSRTSRSHLAPLDASDESNYPAIAQVLLNYQWPMVIANPNLTPAEQDEFLTADVPYAEENFIRRKLQEIDPSYDVAFIPTCVYEMFVLHQINETLQNDDNHSRLMNKFHEHEKSTFNTPLNVARKKLEKNPNVSMSFKNKYKEYIQANHYFYPYAFLYSNNLLAQSLFDQYPLFTTISSSLALSDAIESNIILLATSFIKQGITLTEEQIKVANNSRINGYHNIDINQELLPTKEIVNQNKLLAQIIALEYQARQNNKGLLLRGTKLTTFINTTMEDRNKQAINIADTSINSINNSSAIIRLYKQEDIPDDSLSFGNSLFAGYVHDVGACAYGYLNSRNGYGLFINKKDQIQHQSSNLFSISPLASITALFTKGEMFHSRSKRYSNKIKPSIKTIQFKQIDEPSKDAITVRRDPLRHGQLFSQYLADNMVIISNPGSRTHDSIHPGEFVYDEEFTLTPAEQFEYDQTRINTPDLNPEEQIIYDQKRMKESHQLKTNQKETADYYKSIKQLSDHLPVATKKYRQYLDDEKAFNKIEKTSMETELS